MLNNTIIGLFLQTSFSLMPLLFTKGWTGMSDSQAFQCTPDVLCACPQSEASMLTREQLGARTGKALASALNVTASARKLQNRGKDKQK